MKYLRFATYLVLLISVWIAVGSRDQFFQVGLQSPPYEFQVEALLAGLSDGVVAKAGTIKPLGGLPPGTEWSYRETPDFDVWSATFGENQEFVSVGIYSGRHPDVAPPPEGLVRGEVAGVPVLWWPHRDEHYRSVWDALIPRGPDARNGYLHIWIISYSPDRVSSTAAALQTLRFENPDRS